MCVIVVHVSCNVVIDIAVYAGNAKGCVVMYRRCGPLLCIRWCSVYVCLSFPSECMVM